MKYKFKQGDKVKYHTQDSRHATYKDSVKVGLVYTVAQSYSQFLGEVIELRECNQYNYNANCFKLHNLRKLKINLP